MSSIKPPGIDELWIQHQRRNHGNWTSSWACIHCPDRKIFHSSDELWNHALQSHQNELPQDESERQRYRTKYELDSEKKDSTIKDEYQLRRKATGTQAGPPPPPSKRALDTPAIPYPTRSLTGLQALNLDKESCGSDEFEIKDDSDDGQEAHDQPRKRAAIGDGISAGSVSPYRESLPSPPPRRSKARPTSGTYDLPSDTDSRPLEGFDSQRPSVGGKRQLWSPDDNAPLTRASFTDPSYIASVQAQKSRAAQLQHKFRKPSQSTQQSFISRQPPNFQNPPNPSRSAIMNRPTQNPPPVSSRHDDYDIILQPETRPISQEQLIAEVKGIYAGLVMVETKCVEVDNNQATLLEINGVKLKNEQWQALAALHPTLLHEHLAGQDTFSSPALGRPVLRDAIPAPGLKEKTSSPKYRRGRGRPQKIGVNGSDDPQDPEFFHRDIEIRSQGESPLVARCRLDSQCELPFLMSEHWANENGKLSQISKDFKDPGMQSVSGHKISIDGILRNVVFNLSGSTVTYRRDVYICKQLNGWADMVIGAKFMAEQFAVLFSKAKKMFAGIFSWKKETSEEKAESDLLQEEANLDAAELDRQLRIKKAKAKEERKKEEARKKRGEEEEGRRHQNGGQ